MSILVFIISLAVLVLVHEFGHFIVAKKSGARVDEFGLGFPPKLWSKKWGETLYTINAIPFGGFVKILGENPNEEIPEKDKKRSLSSKSRWVQSAVLVAGVTANLVFAWLLISVGFVRGMPASVDYSPYGQITDARVVLTEVLSDSPAESSGLKVGDKLTSIKDSSSFVGINDISPEIIQDFVSKSQSNNLQVTYVRGNELPTTVSVSPSEDIIAGRKAMGVAMDMVGTLKLPIHLAFIEGARTTWLLVKMTVSGLLGFIGNIFMFKADFSQVSGPVGIFSIFSEATGLGFSYIISLVALISINLAVLNLLPLPALDGGRLLFVIIEAIIRRPVSSKVFVWANTAGFVLLGILMIAVTVKDILKLV